jgi:hypothetical protein
LKTTSLKSSSRRASQNAVSRARSGETEEDYDILADGAVVGRIMRVTAVPEGAPWV